MKPFVPVDTSKKLVGPKRDHPFHFVLSEIQYRGSMSSCVAEKSAYRLHAENRRRSSLPDEMNVGGVARAGTHIPSGETTWLAY
jgi:hypothetical protein